MVSTHLPPTITMDLCGPHGCRCRSAILAFALSASGAFSFVQFSRLSPRSPTRSRIDGSSQLPPLFSTPESQKVCIVGAGVGGLATASRIASAMPNATVTILEKNDRDLAGGRMGSFDAFVDGASGSYRHERGPSLLLLRDEYEKLFEDCGKRTTPEGTQAKSYGLDMKQCVPAYQVVFDDGDRVSVGFPRNTSGLTANDIEQMQVLEQESMDRMNEWEPNGHKKWVEYLDTCAAYLDCGLPNFIEEKLELTSFPAFIWEAMREKGKRWPLKPHSSVLSEIFESPKMVALASFQDLYVGLEPYLNQKQPLGGILRKTAPAVFGLLSAIELHPTNRRAGVFAPLGGFRQVAKSMVELCADNGVEFVFNATVTNIGGGGVHFRHGSSNMFRNADLVICNADIPYASESLINEHKDDVYRETYDWDDSFDFSSGVVAFHWSISKSLRALATHNVFMSSNNTEDAIGSWSVLREGSRSASEATTLIDQPFNFYVHRASATDRSACPSGCDAIMVLVPCPALERNKDIASLSREDVMSTYAGQFDSNVLDDYRKAVIKRLSVLEGLEGLGDYIIDEVVDTPATYASHYNLGAGVPFGLSHGLSQLSLTRPGAEWKNRGNEFMFVGASGRPGNGVPLVLIGSEQVSRKAVELLSTHPK